MTWSTKDPNEQLDYSIDWTPRIVSGDAIASSIWEFHPDNTDAALVIVETSFVLDTNKTIVWLSDGTPGVTYRLINRITTVSNPNRIMDQTMKLRIKER